MVAQCRNERGREPAASRWDAREMTSSISRGDRAGVTRPRLWRGGTTRRTVQRERVANVWEGGKKFERSTATRVVVVDRTQEIRIRAVGARTTTSDRAGGGGARCHGTRRSRRRTHSTAPHARAGGLLMRAASRVVRRLTATAPSLARPLTPARAMATDAPVGTTGADAPEATHALSRPVPPPPAQSLIHN